MNEAQHQRQLQITAQALREAFLDPPDEIRDQGLEDKLLELFQYLQRCDLELQMALAPVEKTDGDGLSNVFTADGDHTVPHLV